MARLYLLWLGHTYYAYTPSKAVMRAALGHHHRRGVILPFAVGPTEGVMDLQASPMHRASISLASPLISRTSLQHLPSISLGAMDLQASHASPLHLPSISPAPPLHLSCISLTSPVHLPCISLSSPLHLPSISPASPEHLPSTSLTSAGERHRWLQLLTHCITH